MQTLRDLRKQAGYSVTAVAEVLNVTPRAYTRYEQGTRRIGIDQVLVLAEIYGVTEGEVIVAQLNSCR